MIINNLKIKVKKMSRKAKMPTKAHPSDAGVDLYSAAQYLIPVGGRALIRTGVAMEIPEGYVGFATGRSGKTVKEGLVGQLGIIDAGYRGEIGIMAFNFSGSTLIVDPGDKVGQIVILPIPGIELEEAEELSESDRGTNGFGSTGK